MIIDFIDDHNYVLEEQQKEIEKLLQFAAEKEGINSDAELSVTFVNNEEIQEINRTYRMKDQPTDVISFAMEEMGEGEIAITGEDLPTILGDIIISIPRTIEQANEYNHSFMRELGFLSIHGFLHLLGYDHMEKEDEQIMFAKQKELLDEYGLHR
ncbi:putative rRNA maturation factor YbeY [Schinkia azotoformans MEV2011]|uniref:Endoribonuclease YbeY n=1 Tax=Schinkia azotoformans MEV2011 TaxID=1348973 RepID=A0A072NL34_SCHAZ|nr:rRNA maturation RNase YbeY [Schinkia azotoformans]KEF38146.1 putative rRNA maturation factor YbeY [Schinkia azotoformans MEV2011]MEC1698005.1 rRNA maturation RNase YbeY [Schinkia azotoformans]MEC1716459.1 rRNA maturation RNase YbeY [Schinkia azotoformans]MEC1727407.1 rRNA maturation RNase YbeY [Schinkia azotoformans]MEC1743480.1 rRNA maturation RNase YbeY [Schinkia azotoformans]